MQYKRKGEQNKGVRGWVKELDARGWSQKKTLTSAGFQVRAASSAPLKRPAPLPVCSRPAALQTRGPRRPLPPPSSNARRLTRGRPPWHAAVRSGTAALTCHRTLPH